MAYYKNTDRHSENYGKIRYFSELDIITVYNCYGCKFLNDDNEWETVNEEDCYFNKDGQQLNGQIFQNGVSQVFFDQVDLFDEDGNEFDPASSGSEIKFYYYWDGHNYRAIILYSDENQFVEWEEDEFNPDNFETIISGVWCNGFRTSYFVDFGSDDAFRSIKMYRFTESQWQGSFDEYEEITNECEIQEILADNCDEDEGYENFSGSVLKLYHFEEGSILVNETPGKPTVSFFTNKDAAENAFNNEQGYETIMEKKIAKLGGDAAVVRTITSINEENRTEEQKKF